MTDKWLNLFDEYKLPDVYICPLRKKSAPILLDGTVKCTYLAA